MKNIHIYLVILGYLCAGCQEEMTQRRYMPVIIDRSEADSYVPKMEDIKGYFDDIRLNDGITIALRYISDTSYGPTYSFILKEGTTGLLSNEDQRRKKTKRFYRQFEDSLNYYNSKQRPLIRSVIWNSVAEELSEASKRDNNVDILLFSDLEEHSFFSVYDSNSRLLLSRKPEVIVERLLEKAPLPLSLDNITLHILHTPPLEDAALFGDMLKVYRELIESRGGKVIVGRHIKIE